MNNVQSILNEYLLQSEKCSLSLLGSFNRIYHPAKIDAVEKLIHPPHHVYTFDAMHQPASTELIDHLAHHHNIDTPAAQNMLEAFSKDWKEKLVQGEKLCFDFVGCLYYESDQMMFTPADRFNHLPVLRAEKVIHKDASHHVLVGDRETNSEVMKDYYSEQTSRASGKWKLWAAILIIAGLITIIISLYNKGFLPDSIGNNHHLKVDEEPKTYQQAKNGQ